MIHIHYKNILRALVRGCFVEFILYEWTPLGLISPHGPPKSPWAPYVPAKGSTDMRVLASGSIFFESGTVDLLGIFWFPGHFELFRKIQILDEKKFFGGTVNQLKKTSDCIKSDPPGPGQNLEKSQKSQKIGRNFGSQKKSKKSPKFYYFFLFLL